jgi:hypothetical protein
MTKVIYEVNGENVYFIPVEIRFLSPRYLNTASYYEVA